ncbi:MAG: site-specific DNA-methyltransferase [Verrucomicrobia bacterium 12-59-8]|nr:MAG: site-specific DNA-methyltransferase [Verrucomicrobia bacterium 12-59-8]
MPGKYDHLSKEQLVALLEEREKEKRLGLVWERDPALVGRDESVNEQFVTLNHDKEASCGSGAQRNLIIEGDNYDALRLLRMTHAGRVKCIYIDPPYNTGNRDFIYNDRFINKEDGWRHSKWIEFMHRRLILAKDLLREDGVIFVSIDDNELFHLGMLMNEVFGEGNFVGNIIWQRVYSPKTSAKHFSTDHDYILAYAFNGEAWTPNLLPRTDEQDKAYKNPDIDDRGPWKAGDLSARNPYSRGIYPITTPGGRTISGPPPGNYWRVSKEKLAEMDADRRIWWGKDGKNSPAIKRFLSEVKQGRVPQTWWPYEEVGHTQEAKQEVQRILRIEETENVFSTPKPVRLIERIVRLSTGKEDIIIDFFAGSGTTGHAVLKLNAEDGGNRQFILVSSTEATDEEPEKNLCRYVCAKRVKRVCEGYGDVQGLGGGFAYLRIEKMEPGRLLRRLQHEQVWITLQMLHLDALTPEAPGGIVWAAGEGKRRLIYLTQTNEKTWGPLERALVENRRATIYTWQPELVKHHAPKATVRPIPKFLMERLGIHS